MKVLMILLCLINFCACSAMEPDASPITQSALAANDNVVLGLTYLQANDMPQAKEKLHLALLQSPKSPISLEAMAYFLEKTGDTSAAAHYYQEAVKLAPNEGMILNNQGVFLCQHQHPKQAIMEFLRAVKDPNYINSAEAYENAGLCALILPDKKLAKLFFNQAIQQDPHREISRQELILLNGNQ